MRAPGFRAEIFWRTHFLAGFSVMPFRLDTDDIKDIWGHVGEAKFGVSFPEPALCGARKILETIAVFVICQLATGKQRRLQLLHSVAQMGQLFGQFS